VLTIFREGFEVLATLGGYEARIRPTAGRHLDRWRRRARQIPDPGLRRAAISALTEKAANVEATAVLATLAPRRPRPQVLRASTALQVAIDYLDTLGEEEVAEPLRDGLQLHQALGAAMERDAEPADWYLHHPQKDDGGYLDRLVAACRQAALTLPRAETILPFARRAAERCGEGQAHTHAASGGAADELESWARELGPPDGFEWWEIAAGASSSVAAHALIALAADPEATAAQAEAVDAAYFPAIGALTVLLDDLVDRRIDEEAGEHNYLRYYPSDAVAAERLTLITERAREQIGQLRDPYRHRAILAGILAYYLSSPQIGDALGPAWRARLLGAAGPAARPLTALLRRR
jgi:tetraprenyl-beta-curcumene synthase